MPLKISSMLLSIIFTGIIISACLAEKDQNRNSDTQKLGFSGLAQINDASFLAVYDLKSFEDGPRLSVISLKDDEGYRIDPVTITDWLHKDGRGSDLEAACKIPGSMNEFLITESGQWDGAYGRIFHVKIDRSLNEYHGEVLGVFDLPVFEPKGPDKSDGDEFEGLACFQNEDDRTFIILGERGGSSAYPNGVLRWAEVDLTSYTLIWTQNGEDGYQVDAPGIWENRATNRDISGLYLDKENVLWGTGSEDLGDAGPFQSVIYKLGRIDINEDEPVILESNLEVVRYVAGFKIEGISSGLEGISGSKFSIATEDEVYGGVWRVIN